MISPSTKMMLDIIGVPYVDNTDIFILNDFATNELNVHSKSQGEAARLYWRCSQDIEVLLLYGGLQVGCGEVLEQ